MVDVQLSGVAPAGGAGIAAGAGGNAAAIAPVAAVPASAPVPADAPGAQGDLLAALPSAPAQAGIAAAAPGLPRHPLPTDLQVKDAVKNANAALAAIGTQLVFVFDDQAHHLAVKLLDIQTQKVVQQIPTAAMHATASALSDHAASGALVDTKA